MYNRNNSSYVKNHSTSFTNDPRLTNIDPKKLKIIEEIKRKSNTMPLEALLPEILKINQELNKRNMSFTKKESDLLLSVIEESLSSSDKQKFNMLKSFI